MAIKVVELTDPWAVRELTICVRDVKALPPFARELVEAHAGGNRVSAGKPRFGRQVVEWTAEISMTLGEWAVAASSRSAMSRQNWGR